MGDSFERKYYILNEVEYCVYQSMRKHVGRNTLNYTHLSSEISLFM